MLMIKSILSLLAWLLSYANLLFENGAVEHDQCITFVRIHL